MNLYLYLVIVTLVMAIVTGFCVSQRPTIEPFTRQFFNQIKKTEFIGIDQNQLFGNEFDLITTIGRLVPFNLNLLMLDQSMDRYQSLNQNQIQLIMARSNELHNILYKVTPTLAKYEISHVRFVCALYHVPVNILTTEMGIGEFGQLKGSKLTVNVGTKDSSDYFIAVDLFLQYQLIVDQDIYVTYYDVNQLVDHYGDDVQVAIMTRTHPDKMIVNLVNKRLTRLIEILRYNNGHPYTMSLDEEPFYKQYPYYSKTIIEKTKLSEYYTNLVVNKEIFNIKTDRPVSSYQSRFINTIAIKYYLMSNIQTPSTQISQLLYNMKLNMNLINQLPFIDDALNTASLTDFTLPIAVHEGARSFFQSTGLYTNLSNPNCLLINGRCDQQQLKEHHLEHDFGPTFDQMFNASP